MEPILPQSFGYAIILALGIFFAVLMVGVTKLQNRFSNNKTSNIDEFSASSRNIPVGLMVVSIVLSWTWSLTLLQSATQTYQIGLAGAYYYGVGGLIQVSVFAIVASKVKSNANLVTTFPEMAYFRFGNAGHLTFLFCGLVCNTIVSSCILIGGGTVFSAATGMNAYAAFFLLPFVCAVYVVFGGLRATFISDATHTFVLLIFLMVFAFYVYVGSDKIGSASKMYDLLVEQAIVNPASSNLHGSYLTYRSGKGAVVYIMSIFTGFGLVCLDQAYWSRAVASKASTTSKAYFIGACAWFIIPVAMGVVLGLAARACNNFSDFYKLSDTEVSGGLAPVAAASYLMGKAGGALIIIMVFLSVISSFSGELIATSTLISYDIYKKYIDRKATPKKVLIVSQIAVFFWALFAGLIASIFHKVGINLGWLFYFLGTSTCSVVFPVTLTFTWKKLNKTGAIVGSLGGMASALIMWLVVCKYRTGSINVVNLSDAWSSFAGNITALFMGGILSVGFTLLKPDDFDWESTRNRTILVENVREESKESEITYELGDVENVEKSKDASSKNDYLENQFDVSSNSSSSSLPEKEEIQQKELATEYKKYTIAFLVLAFAFLILIPVPQIAAPYTYSKGFFTFVVVVVFIWIFWTFSVCIIWPLWENRHFLAEITKDLLGIKPYRHSEE